MTDFIECRTGAVVPVGPVTEDSSDQGRMQAVWSVLVAVNPGAAVVYEVQYERELRAFGRIAIMGHRNDELEPGELVDALALTRVMIQEIREALPDGWDFFNDKKRGGGLGIWRMNATME